MGFILYLLSCFGSFGAVLGVLYLYSIKFGREEADSKGADDSAQPLQAEQAEDSQSQTGG